MTAHQPDYELANTACKLLGCSSLFCLAVFAVFQWAISRARLARIGPRVSWTSLGAK
jgi:hypothetical protein